jgi:hypothetical protein
MRSVSLAVLVGVLAARGGAAQNAAPPPVPMKAPPTRVEVVLDPPVENSPRLQRLEKMRREHSDASGRLRPDLEAKGIAQFRRMAVASPLVTVAPPAPARPVSVAPVRILP